MPPSHLGIQVTSNFSTNALVWFYYKWSPRCIKKTRKEIKPLSSLSLPFDPSLCPVPTNTVARLCRHRCLPLPCPCRSTAPLSKPSRPNLEAATGEDRFPNLSVAVTGDHPIPDLLVAVHGCSTAPLSSPSRRPDSEAATASPTSWWR